MEVLVAYSIGVILICCVFFTVVIVPTEIENSKKRKFDRKLKKEQKILAENFNRRTDKILNIIPDSWVDPITETIGYKYVEGGELKTGWADPVIADDDLMMQKLRDRVATF